MKQIEDRHGNTVRVGDVVCWRDVDSKEMAGWLENLGRKWAFVRHPALGKFKLKKEEIWASKN